MTVFVIVVLLLILIASTLCLCVEIDERRPETQQLRTHVDAQQAGLRLQLAAHRARQQLVRERHRQVQRLGNDEEAR